jgi:hypothetical protein
VRVLLGRDVHGRRDLLARHEGVTIRGHMHMVNALRVAPRPFTLVT